MVTFLPIKNSNVQSLPLIKSLWYKIPWSFLPFVIVIFKQTYPLSFSFKVFSFSPDIPWICSCPLFVSLYTNRHSLKKVKFQVSSSFRLRSVWNKMSVCEIQDNSSKIFREMRINLLLHLTKKLTCHVTGILFRISRI